MGFQGDPGRKGDKGTDHDSTEMVQLQQEMNSLKLNVQSIRILILQKFLSLQKSD